MYLTSRQLWAIINPARRQAGLPPYKSFKIACSILQRNGCPTRKIDPHHTLYNAAAAISILTRPAKNREPLNTYTPPTTAAEIARLLKNHPRQKQHYTPSEKTHTQRATARARQAAPRHAQLARARQAAAAARAQCQAEKAARREKTRRAALTELQKIKARRLHLTPTSKDTKDTKATLRARGYIPLCEALTIFNAIRATRNLAPYKTLNALHKILCTHHCPRLKATTCTSYYCAAHVEHLARTIQPRACNYRKTHRRNLHPTASQEELDSGEYTTFKQFCALTGLPEYTVKSHALRHNFHAIQHPDTGHTIIHTATAAIHEKYPQTADGDPFPPRAIL